MVSDRFRFHYRLTPEHFQSYARMVVKRSKRSDGWARFLSWLVIGVLGAGLAVLLQKAGFVSRESSHFIMAGVLFSALATIILNVILSNRTSSRMVGAHDAIIGNFNLAAYEAGGLQITGKHMQSSFDWTAFVGLTQSSDIMVIWVDWAVGIILPDNAFSDKQEKQEFIDFVNERIEAHQKQDDFPGNE